MTTRNLGFFFIHVFNFFTDCTNNKMIFFIITGKHCKISKQSRLLSLNANSQGQVGCCGQCLLLVVGKNIGIRHITDYDANEIQLIKDNTHIKGTIVVEIVW